MGLSLPLRGQPPFASVLIYFRNDHYLLHECLTQLKRNEFRNFEVVVLDDASDRPLSASGLPPGRIGIDFRLIRSDEPLGFDRGMARLAEAARGKLLISQRAADFMREDRLNVQIRYMFDHMDVAAAGAGANQVDKSSRVLRSDLHPTDEVAARGFVGEAASVAAWASRIDPMRFSAALQAVPGDDGELGLIGLMSDDAKVANAADILYFRRAAPEVKMAAAAEAQSEPENRGPVVPYHHLYYRMRVALGERGLSVLADFRPEDEEGLKKAIAMYEVLLRPFADEGELGQALGIVSYMEWQRGDRSLLGLAKAWSRIPRSASKLMNARIKRQTQERYIRVRNVAARVLPRGVILGPKGAAARLRSRSRRVPREEPKLRAIVYDTWGDLPDALDHLLPHGGRMWRGVRFIPAAAYPPDEKAPDYALVLNHVGREPVEVNVPPNRVWYAIGEPPTPAHADLQLGGGVRSTILTPDASLPALSTPGGRTYTHTLCMTRTWSVKRTIDELEKMSPPKKTKTLSWVTSNLALLPGHRYRLAFLDRIKDKTPLTLFGRGFKPLDDKWDGLAPFKYSIAFENTVAEGYITEKLFDCWVAGALPLYFGAPDVEKHFPAKALIRIDPEDPHVVEKIRETAESGLWRERADAIAEARRLVLTKHNMFKFIAERMLADETPADPPESQWLYPVDVDFS
jgi:hypothetical protein